MVLWEILNKTALPDLPVKPGKYIFQKIIDFSYEVFSLILSEYSPPYGHLVSDQPSKDMMRSVVVSKKQRPNIRPVWAQKQSTKYFTKIIEEAWDKDPEARLTASAMLSRVKSCAEMENISLESETVKNE